MKLAFAALALALALPASAEDARVAPIKAALKAERWDAAVEAGEKLVKEAPESSEAQMWLGRAYGQKALKASLFSQMGWAKKCKASFEKAVALDPKDVDARVDLLQYYANAPGIAGGGIDKARAQQKALDGLDPVRGAQMNGFILLKEKKPAEAEAEYRRAVSLAPENGSAHWRLGRVLERGGKKDEAKASYKEALRLDPTLEGAKKDLERLGG
ncbi:MAG: tetratricopeptide repeat protein [Acidobacteria bacterium]|nr:tetratricopeptide repeat protein [Acidobacteriota bacterium]